MGKAVALLAVLMFLALSTVLLVKPNVVGAVMEVDTSTFISVPATAEVAQGISVKMWIEPPPPNPTDLYHNITLSITRPDGVTNLYTALLQDENATLWWSYKPNQLGNFTFQFSYSGEAFDNGAIIYKPSTSSVATLTVTGDPLPRVEAPGGFWTQKESMHQARGALGVEAVNGKIYAIGGCTKNGSYSQYPITGFVGTNEEYNPSTDTWILKTSMPTPRSNFAIAACKNKIYCIGGIIGYKLDDNYHLFNVSLTSGANEVYDPATDTWETKAPMPTAGSNMIANVVNDKIYIFDGTANWVYDPASESWSTKAPAPIQVGGYPSAVVDNKIYVISNYSPVQIYDTLTDSWSQGTRSPRLDPNGLASATTGIFAPKRIYLFAVAQYGWVPYGYSDITGPSRRTNFIYNPETDRWSAGTIIPTFRADFGVAEVNDKLYAVGGYVYEDLYGNSVKISAVNEEYTPISYGNVNPTVHVFSPKMQTYSITTIFLNFTVDKQTVWLGYALDSKEKVTITGNITLAELTSGLHNITVYAKDEADNIGESETITFSIAKQAGASADKHVPESFPTTTVVLSASAVTAGIAILIYYHAKKQKSPE